MSESTNSPAAFLADLDWSLPDQWTWMDDEAFLRLDDDRHVRVTLSTQSLYAKYPTQGHYRSLNVTIVSKTQGTLAKKHFAFDAFLHDRSDSRTDYKLNPEHGGDGFQVIDFIGWHWYIAVPRNTVPLIDAVETYIGLFR